jgi:molecular chaperone DnaK
MSGKTPPPHYIGIDFGTSKCVTTWYNPKRDEVEVINDHETGDWQTPSAVYYPQRGTPVVGQVAQNILTDADSSTTDAERVVLSAKRNIARPMRFMFDPYPTPQQVATEIFRKLRRNLIEGHFHFPVTNAVVTVPASYDRVQRDAIRQSALAAGFEQVVLVDEPTAAAIAYSREAYVAQNVRESTTSLPHLGNAFLVYDLGAGTFDLSVLRRKRGNLDSREKTFPYEVGLKPLGMAFGGDDIDRAIYHYLDDIAQEKYNRPISTTERYDNRFLMQCRRAKVSLGYLNSATISMLLRPSGDGTLSGERARLVRFQHTLEQSTFQEIIRPLLESTLSPVERLLEKAREEGLGNSGDRFPLDNIILIGGSSKIPLVRQILEEHFKIHIFSWMNQDRAVALGAAYVAFDVFGPGQKQIAPPPPIAARFTVMIPPVQPALKNPETQQPQTVALSQAGNVLAESPMDKGLHITFNLRPGPTRLLPGIASLPSDASVAYHVKSLANTHYQIRWEFDPQRGCFQEPSVTTALLNLLNNESDGGSPAKSNSPFASSIELPAETVLTPTIGDGDSIGAALIETLRNLSVTLQTAGVDNRLVQEFSDLANAVEAPCTVAVVGRVKAGKSTFVNALLGEDLAKTGATETTATINRFSFGTPNPQRPVRCHWSTAQGKRVTDETVAFLDSLQGNSAEVLQRAKDIEYLEYRLERDFLRRVTLVDTPGMEAAVEEHNERVSRYLGLEKELAERNFGLSRSAALQADAIIYVIRPVPRLSDKEFLHAFEEAIFPGSGSLNAMGIVAKVDDQLPLFEKRHALCQQIIRQLPGKLNTVFPVSAALQRYIDTVSKVQLRTLIQEVRRIERDETISDACPLGFLLGSDARWKNDPDPGCPVSPEMRAKLAEGLPWATFVLMVRLIARHPTGEWDEVLTELRGAAGFEPLREALYHRFVQRGDLLRAYRIVQLAQDMLGDFIRHHLTRVEEATYAELERYERYLNFIRASSGTSGTHSHSAVRAELEVFFQEALHTIKVRTQVRTQVLEAERRLTLLFHTLQDHHADQDALADLANELAESPHTFTPEEQAELRALLGTYGRSREARLAGLLGTPEAIGQRMAYWANIARLGMIVPRRQSIAAVATQRYGILLDDVLREQSPLEWAQK